MDRCYSEKGRLRDSVWSCQEILIGFSLSLLAFPWWPQNVSSPVSNLTLINACAPQTSQRSDAVSVGSELVSMIRNITRSCDSYFMCRNVSLIAKC